MRTSRVLAMAIPLLAAGASLSAELKPSTYSKLFSHATIVASGTVGGVSTGLFSDGRKARIKVDGLYKGRLRENAIEVAWKDEEHRETCFEDGARVILFLDRHGESGFAQAAPGVSCWKVEKIAFGQGRPSNAVSYEFPLDLIAGIPKGAIRETEVVEKSLNFQVPKRKRWILVDALLPQLKPWKPPRPAKPPRPPKAKAKPKSA